MQPEQDIFARARLLVGADAFNSIASKRVLLLGVGGVGSWCAESLVRSGIIHLTMVDADTVNPTNINRQLMATTQTVGRPKVEVMAERLREINPEADITPVQGLFSEETAGEFQLDTYDYIIDCIDSLKDKTALIELATHTQATFFSSMGAALKLDPTRIQVAEFWKVKGDPLARALRNRFKKEKTFPRHKFQCVFSDETPQTKGEGKGSLVHITAVFGMMLAGLVIQDATRVTM